jgi:hypothetical protein
VIVLDHNITREQAELLIRWNIRFLRIGVEIGLPSWDDEQEILRYLHRSKHLTFFTRDSDFFRYRLCHRNYCLATIDMAEVETASAIRRFLRHPMFRTKVDRCGKVIKLQPRQLIWLEMGKRGRTHLIW